MNILATLFGTQKKDVTDTPAPTPLMDKALANMGEPQKCPDLADNMGWPPEAREFFSKYSTHQRHLGRGYPHNFPAS